MADWPSRQLCGPAGCRSTPSALRRPPWRREDRRRSWRWRVGTGACSGGAVSCWKPGGQRHETSVLEHQWTDRHTGKETTGQLTSAARSDVWTGPGSDLIIKSKSKSNWPGDEPKSQFHIRVSHRLNTDSSICHLHLKTRRRSDWSVTTTRPKKSWKIQESPTPDLNPGRKINIENRRRRMWSTDPGIKVSWRSLSVTNGFRFLRIWCLAMNQVLMLQTLVLMGVHSVIYLTVTTTQPDQESQSDSTLTLFCVPRY